jgi:lipopolysaccharide transport system permease protein
LPYHLFVFAGLLPWTFFANGITSAAMSLVNSQSLITKIYFPRMIVPFSTVVAGLVDFAVAFGVLIGMMIWYGIRPGANLLMCQESP